MSPVGAISVSPARLSNQFNSAPLPICSLLFQRHGPALLRSAIRFPYAELLVFPLPPLVMAFQCVPLPWRHGAHPRTTSASRLTSHLRTTSAGQSFANLSTAVALPIASKHDLRVAVHLLSRPYIALCSTSRFYALPFAPPIIADCCAKLIRSLPIKALRCPYSAFRINAVPAA